MFLKYVFSTCTVHSDYLLGTKGFWHAFVQFGESAQISVCIEWWKLCKICIQATPAVWMRSRACPVRKHFSNYQCIHTSFLQSIGLQTTCSLRSPVLKTWFNHVFARTSPLYSTVRAPVFGRHQFFGTSEHYGKAHGILLSGWMNYNYTACRWFPTSSNSFILPSQSWQIRFESYWLHCSKYRKLVLLRYTPLQIIYNLTCTKNMFPLVVHWEYVWTPRMLFVVKRLTASGFFSQQIHISKL